ncbi:hypothetical protein TNCV_3260621 [Trichonephila clavipes]|nr:hypothetical protein TNCV_3260621 [Trichonephila clavipes]
MNLGREDQKEIFRRVQNIEYLKELCRRTVKLIVICQNLERKKPKRINSNAHHKRLQPQTTKWKKSGVPTSHREEDTTRRTNSFQKRQRKENDSPYIEERTRSNIKNARRGDDQQRQDQERKGACTRKSLSLEVLVGNANYKS